MRRNLALLSCTGVRKANSSDVSQGDNRSLVGGGETVDISTTSTEDKNTNEEKEKVENITVERLAENNQSSKKCLLDVLLSITYKFIICR